MSLTSYRAAPPRVKGSRKSLEKMIMCVWQTWQRLTLPRLETKYHQRWSVSRPSSEWDRVQPLRHNHQVGKTHMFEKLVFSRYRLLCIAVRWARAMRMIKPIELLVPVSFTHYCASTPGLSTWSSTTTLREYSFSGGFPA